MKCYWSSTSSELLIVRYRKSQLHAIGRHVEDFFLFIHMILPRLQRLKFGDGETFHLSSSVQVLPLDVTTFRDSYAWNYRELVTLLTLSESLADVRLEPLTIGSMRKNLTIEPF